MSGWTATFLQTLADALPCGREILGGPPCMLLLTTPTELLPALLPACTAMWRGSDPAAAALAPRPTATAVMEHRGAGLSIDYSTAPLTYYTMAGTLCCAVLCCAAACPGRRA